MARHIFMFSLLTLIIITTSPINPMIKDLLPSFCKLNVNFTIPSLFVFFDNVIGNCAYNCSIRIVLCSSHATLWQLMPPNGGTGVKVSFYFCCLMQIILQQFCTSSIILILFFLCMITLLGLLFWKSTWKWIVMLWWVVIIHLTVEMIGFWRCTCIHYEDRTSWQIPFT